MGDAWLDKLDEIQALHDEITIDVEEKTRLDRQGHGTDRIATRISRDTSRLESGLRTLSENLSKLPLSAQEKGRRERLLGKLVKSADDLTGSSQRGGSGSQSRNSLLGQTSSSGSGHYGSNKGSRQAETIIEIQQTTMAEQDDGLDALYQSVLRQKELGNAIGDELDVQSNLLDDLGHAMDSTGSSLGRQQSRVEELMESAGKSGNTMIICGLSTTLIVLTMLVLGII